MIMRKNKSKKYSEIKYKGLEEKFSSRLFCKKVVGGCVFETTISIERFEPDGTGYQVKKFLICIVF